MGQINLVCLVKGHKFKAQSDTRHWKCVDCDYEIICRACNEECVNRKVCDASRNLNETCDTI